MSDEIYCGRRVVHVETHGVMKVYSIPSYRSMGCPKYIVFHRNGRALEDFRRKPAAIKWAKENQNG
jgi:hypothetical protein